MNLTEFLVDEPSTCSVPLTMLFAHGAGAGMDSPFMNYFASQIAQQGIRVVRFEFPYMAQRRVSGSRRPPDRLPRLLEHYQSVVAEWGKSGPCVVAGKSMGGRVASHVVAETCEAMSVPTAVIAAISLGYPFHPIGKVEQVRDEHWPAIKRPWLIVQGTRDKLGDQQQVTGYRLPSFVQLHWLPDGDHDFKPRQRSGYTQQQHWCSAVTVITSFIKKLEHS